MNYSRGYSTIIEKFCMEFLDHFSMGYMTIRKPSFSAIIHGELTTVEPVDVITLCDQRYNGIHVNNKFYELIHHKNREYTFRHENRYLVINLSVSPVRYFKYKYKVY